MDALLEFLPCRTPDAWINAAVENEKLLLIDHAHCEKKAAATALYLIGHYPEHHALLQKLSRLAREELRHFEQVLQLMDKRGYRFVNISAARYAKGLRALVRHQEPGRLVDTLIVGAIIEARSCERFASVAPHLAPDLQDFYEKLLKSEMRHFQVYLDLAQRYSSEPIDSRIALLLDREAELITTPDSQFRFHSGVPE